MRKRKVTYIQNNIRAFYRTRIICPLILIVVLAALSIATPVRTMFMPREARLGASLEQLYEDNSTFVNITFDRMYFTGYTNEFLNRVVGYYYYTQWGNGYVIVLVSPTTCQQGIPHMELLSGTFRIETSPRAFDSLFPMLAKDLNWTSGGIEAEMNGYLLSEPAARSPLVIIALAFYAAALLYGVYNLIAYIVFIISPVLSPFIRRLGPIKEVKKTLEQAEEELSQRPQLASEEMYITENYLIEMSESEFTLIHLDDIMWVYRHAQLRFFLGHIRPVKEALYIVTKDRRTFKCSELRTLDMDGIIDYLSEANHDILIGYSEENRIKAEHRYLDSKKNKGTEDK